jgi:ketosteroid isomerase-like protein
VSRGTLLLGAAAGLGARSLFGQAFLWKLKRDLAALNAGDYRPLLANYADDAILRFAEGDHRWAGEHRGKAAIERFFQDFVAAGITGELLAMWFAGPPWDMTVMVRFDDEARAPDGERIYRNRTALSLRARWGKVVLHEDFYEDTSRIERFDAVLRERGVPPVGAQPQQA